MTRAPARQLEKAYMEPEALALNDVSARLRELFRKPPECLRGNNSKRGVLSRTSNRSVMKLIPGRSHSTYRRSAGWRRCSDAVVR